MAENLSISIQIGQFMVKSLQKRLRLADQKRNFYTKNQCYNQQVTEMRQISLSNRALQKIGKHNICLHSCDQVIQLSHTFVEELRESKSIPKRNHQQDWTTQQKDYFIIFWIQKICNNPSKNYLFSLPLNRNDYFKDLSRFLAHYLGQQKFKTDKQCKSKFSSIKRKIKGDKMKGKVPQAYEFIDYLKAQANKRKCFSEEIRKALQVLQSMETNVSELVLTIRKMWTQQNNVEINYKNNQIYKYLEAKGELIDQSH